MKHSRPLYKPPTLGKSVPHNSSVHVRTGVKTSMPLIDLYIFHTVLQPHLLLTFGTRALEIAVLAVAVPVVLSYYCLDQSKSVPEQS